MQAEAVQFLEPGELVDGDLRLELRRTFKGSRSLNLAPNYAFAMRHAETGARMGDIDLRLSGERYITHYAGHIGYGVDKAYRGHGYAARACRLLLPLAQAHGLERILIATTDAGDQIHRGHGRERRVTHALGRDPGDRRHALRHRPRRPVAPAVRQCAGSRSCHGWSSTRATSRPSRRSVASRLRTAPPSSG